MTRPSSARCGRGIDKDGLLPNSGARSQGPIGGCADASSVAGNDESLGFFGKAWLFLTDADYYEKSIGPSHIDRSRARSYEIHRRHGTFYGFTNQQRDEIHKAVYESTKGAIPLAETVAAIATLPFGGGASVGAKLAARFGLSGAAKAVTVTFVDSLGKEVAAVGVEMLAGKDIDYAKRAREIAAKVALGALGAGAVAKLAPILKERFVQLAETLSKYRLAGLDLAKVRTAESAVDAGIVEKAISTIVASAENAAYLALK